MTAVRRAKARSLPRAEWERLLREKSYLRPLAPVVPLHTMGRRRELAASEPEDETGEPRRGVTPLPAT